MEYQILLFEASLRRPGRSYPACHIRLFLHRLSHPRIQEKYNKEHNITPRSIKKAVRDLISISKNVEKEAEPEKDPESMNCKELESEIAKTQKQMKKAAAELDFEKAAELRDRMIMLKKHLQETEE